MPRQPRAELHAGIHHVTARGCNGCSLFVDDLDHSSYLHRLGDATQQFGWRCLSYCLMGNHLHLILETLEPNLGQGMQLLQGQYANAFNVKYARKGHLYGERFFSARIEDDSYLAAALRYVARNPVQAGLADTPASYRWSSAAALVGLATPPPWLDVDRVHGLFQNGAASVAELFAVPDVAV